MVRVKCPSCGQFVTLNLNKIIPESKEETTPRPTLTARDVLTDTMARTIREMLTITTWTADSEPPRVVIADEPRAFREFLRKSLEEIGCHVTMVDDGSSVEAMLNDRAKPHVVFMNVVLKGTLGFVLCERIKNTPGSQPHQGRVDRRHLSNGSVSQGPDQHVRSGRLH